MVRHAGHHAGPLVASPATGLSVIRASIHSFFLVYILSIFCVQGARPARDTGRDVAVRPWHRGTGGQVKGGDGCLRWAVRLLWGLGPS